MACMIILDGMAAPGFSYTLDPNVRQDPAKGAGESSNITKRLPTGPGDDLSDDVLWQNLLAAEWLIFSFYDTGVNAFNTSSFTELGLPNTT